MNMVRETLAERLAKTPFEPFAILTADGRRIEVNRADQAVLNSIAVSVVGAGFSLTVLGYDQVSGFSPLE